MIEKRRDTAFAQHQITDYADVPNQENVNFADRMAHHQKLSMQQVPNRSRNPYISLSNPRTMPQDHDVEMASC